MKPSAQRLKRLRRLEKLRAIARHTVLGEAAQAEGTLAQLTGLAERTRLLAREYGAREQMQDGAGLRQHGQFVGGLSRLHDRTRHDAARARDLADAKMAELAAAERRRAAVEERAEREARALSRDGGKAAHGARKALGTELE